jgi:hypothetical protein
MLPSGFMILSPWAKKQTNVSKYDCYVQSCDGPPFVLRCEAVFSDWVKSQNLNLCMTTPDLELAHTFNLSNQLTHRQQIEGHAISGCEL